MKLVIVESPHKSLTIGKYLGADYHVEASQGHIRDLSTRGKGGLGIDIEHDFKPDYVISSGKAGIVNKLRDLSRKADETILATDPDREGEAIAWHLAEVLHLDLAKTKRLRFHEITPSAIKEAMEDPEKVNLSLVDSQETRRMFDRILGFRLSGMLKKEIGSQSAGRVQSVALRMVIDNDEEIRKFVPEPYWAFEIYLGKGKEALKASIDRIDGKAPNIQTEADASALESRLLGQKAKLVSLSKSKRVTPPKYPLTTSTLQQEAFNHFKFSTSVTMRIAQRLYEGVTIRGETIGLISYMRTDNPEISQDFYDRHAKPFILRTFGPDYLGHVKKASGGINRQDAHEAIRPTGTSRTPASLKGELSPEEWKLYSLIYERAIGSMMKEKIDEVTTAYFEVNGVTLKVSGARTLFPGFASILPEPSEEKEFPDWKEGEIVPIGKFLKERKMTQPPARLTEAKIVKMMEEQGIGRPSTYASTIGTLKKHKYISIQKGVINPTEEGIKTIAFLEKYYPEILSSSYTAAMEENLDEISRGEESKLHAMQEFYEPFQEKFEEVLETVRKDPWPLDEAGKKCPKCGAPLYIKRGRYGTFIGCETPGCRYHENYVKDLGKVCPLCGKPLIEKKAKNGNTFIGCSGFPECNYILPKKAPKKPMVSSKSSATDTGRICPQCKTGHLVLRNGPKGSFIGCSNYPSCKYHEWTPKKK